MSTIIELLTVTGPIRDSKGRAAGTCEPGSCARGGHANLSIVRLGLNLNHVRSRCSSSRVLELSLMFYTAFVRWAVQRFLAPMLSSKGTILSVRS